MSREERRQYERMMRGMERGPALPPAARIKAERAAVRRAARSNARQPGAAGAFTARFWIVSVLVAIAIGYIGMSIAWGRPDALVLGALTAVAALAAQVGIRFVMRRAAARRA